MSKYCTLICFEIYWKGKTTIKLKISVLLVQGMSMQNVPNEDLFSSRLLQPRSNIYSRLVCDFSRQQADLCGFAAADNGDSATQQHTDGALAASTS